MSVKLESMVDTVENITSIRINYSIRKPKMENSGTKVRGMRFRLEIHQNKWKSTGNSKSDRPEWDYQPHITATFSVMKSVCVCVFGWMDGWVGGWM